MTFCKDCKYENDGLCHVREFNMVTGERRTGNYAVPAMEERSNNLVGRCGFEAKLFAPGNYVPRQKPKSKPKLAKVSEAVVKKEPVKVSPAKKSPRKPRAKKA